MIGLRVAVGRVEVAPRVERRPNGFTWPRVNCSMWRAVGLEAVDVCPEFIVTCVRPCPLTVDVVAEAVAGVDPAVEPSA